MFYNNECNEMITINIILEKYPNIKEYLFFNNKLTGRSHNLIESSKYMSSGEQFLVKLSLDLWDGSGNALLKDVYNTLDSSNYINVIRAINLKIAGF